MVADDIHELIILLHSDCENDSPHSGTRRIERTSVNFHARVVVVPYQLRYEKSSHAANTRTNMERKILYNEKIISKIFNAFINLQSLQFLTDSYSVLGVEYFFSFDSSANFFLF